jgi:predicted transcriptional regulator
MSSASRVVLLSVRSPHLERILEGSKTVEFRRRPWNVPIGSVVLLYGSRERRAIVGSFVVAETKTGSVSQMWRTYGARSGLKRSEFFDYVEGAPSATAISVTDVRMLPEPLSLEELRRRRPEFHVPQSYRFMDEVELGAVLNGERRHLLGPRPASRK